MPGALDGLGVARALRERRPDVPIIYITGRPGMLNALVPLGAKEALVAKPFTPTELLAAVRRLLGGAPAA